MPSRSISQRYKMRNSINFIILIFLINYAEALRSIGLKSLKRHGSDPKIVGGSSHPCYRKCVAGENLVCDYNFTLTQYTAMSYACRDCPMKIEDCFREGCITAGGNVRPVTVANQMLPGPSIQVCEGDTIRVKVLNAFTSETATIHWHGINQIGTPFMDGTPFLTQCPIPPHNTFEYIFKASPAGTHIWHSHVGFEEADGLYGSLVVRKPDDPLENNYDYDLADHVMIIWHWYDTSTAYRLVTALHKRGPVTGYGLLINGLAQLAEISLNNTVYKTPRKIFEVETGKRYRFRTIYNSAVYCPVQISIDNHTLIIIASESGTFEPIEVESFIINAGERYDFVLSATQNSSNYWIRYRGLGDCGDKVKVSELAVLRYKNSKIENPSGGTNYEDANRSGILLNPVQAASQNYTNNKLIKFVELNDTTPNREDISGKPDQTFYFKFSFNTYESYFAPGPYPQMNDLSFEFPPYSLLTEGNEITSDMYCTENNDTNKECVNGFCSCPIIYRAAKDSLVEIVFVDASAPRDMDHPMHMHGHNYHVVSMESIGPEITLEAIKNLNEANMIKKKLQGAPVKDTIGVPAWGYTIIRFIAKNPGYWFFHCHISNHAEMGMGVVLKIGEANEMAKAPSDFPKCGPPHCTSSSSHSDAQLSSYTRYSATSIIQTNQEPIWELVRINENSDNRTVKL